MFIIQLCYLSMASSSLSVPPREFHIISITPLLLVYTFPLISPSLPMILDFFHPLHDVVASWKDVFSPMLTMEVKENKHAPFVSSNLASPSIGQIQAQLVASIAMNRHKEIILEVALRVIFDVE